MNSSQRARTERRLKIAVISETDARHGIYGIDELEALGYEILSPSSKTLPVPKKIVNALEHRLGFKIFRVIQSLALIRKADLVLCIFEPYGELPAILKRLKLTSLRKKPLVVMSCWLGEQLSLNDSRRNMRYSRNFRGADLITVFSKNQIELFNESGFETNKVVFLPFGYAPSLFDFAATPRDEIKIVAIGWDRGRDYQTMFKAVDGKPYSVELYCSEQNLKGLEVPKNVIWKGTVPFEHYRQVLKSANIVIVPTKNLAYPTGQTVALEAAASGCCLIIGDTKPMREYFSDETVLFYEPGSYKDLAQQIDLAVFNSDIRSRFMNAAHDSVSQGFTYENMWKQFDTLVTSRTLLP